MDTEEPTDIRDFLPPGAEIQGVEQQVELSTLLQMIGEREVQLLMLRQQVTSLSATVARLAKRPRTEESDTPSR